MSRQPPLDTERRQPMIEIAQRLRELFLARNPLREIELAADHGSRVV